MTDKIKGDDIVRHLIVDGKKPEDTIMVYGFAGEGSQEDTTILYLDPVLQSSVEIKDEDILHAVSVTRTHTSLGGSILWIKNASSYLNKQTTQSQEEAQQFFQGDIYQEYVNTTVKKQNDTQQCQNIHAPTCCSCK